jgi:glucan phosphoethanolaminetransferase (alkaline phosphatase superfamily)
MSVHAVILGLLLFLALVWAAGFSYFIRKVKTIALVVLLVSAAACWWAAHYLNVLSHQTELAPDLQWHRIYMICLLILIPSSLVVGGVLGLIKQQKDYLTQYPSSN